MYKKISIVVIMVLLGLGQNVKCKMFEQTRARVQEKYGAWKAGRQQKKEMKERVKKFQEAKEQKHKELTGKELPVPKRKGFLERFRKEKPKPGAPAETQWQPGQPGKTGLRKIKPDSPTPSFHRYGKYEQAIRKKAAEDAYWGRRIRESEKEMKEYVRREERGDPMTTEELQERSRIKKQQKKKPLTKEELLRERVKEAQKEVGIGEKMKKHKWAKTEMTPQRERQLEDAKWEAYKYERKLQKEISGSKTPWWVKD